MVSSAVEWQTPHPLRTEEWELEVNWKNQTQPTLGSILKTRRLSVDFADNGYFRVASDAHNEYMLGQWELLPSGLRCSLNSTLLLHADLHLNPFGKHPRLSRGVIVDTVGTGWNGRRLVVGTFTGHGVGRDTVDLSYQRRR
jgi:hypothetical protein